MKNKRQFLYGAFQVIVITACGISVGDIWYKIVISAAGIIFNFLVSYGKHYGFIIGAFYAMAYGIMSYTENVYASALFMIAVQLPMAIISFVTWKKQNTKEVKMQSISLKSRLLTFFTLVIIHIIIFLLLSKTNASNSFFDAFFFATSLISCILLAKKKKESYFIIMLSGIAGTLLWLSQFIRTGDGISVLLLNFFVFLNSVKGLIIQSKHSRSYNKEI